MTPRKHAVFRGPEHGIGGVVGREALAERRRRDRPVAEGLQEMRELMERYGVRSQGVRS